MLAAAVGRGGSLLARWAAAAGAAPCLRGLAALAAAAPQQTAPQQAWAPEFAHAAAAAPCPAQPQQQDAGTYQRRRASVYEFMPKFRGLLVDAAGTLLIPSEPAAEVYLRIAKKYGCELSPDEVLQRFREAYNTPWGKSTIRYVGDGRPFWRHIVQESTGCCSEEMFEELYEYYARGSSYHLMPGAAEALQRIRSKGVRTAVVSNFDTRLRRILAELHADSLFDAVVVSAELQAEKPNPVIFQEACAALGLPPEQCIHVGDDRRNDLHGARDSGCYALLWGCDVHSFAEVERRLETGNILDSLDAPL